MMTKEITEYYFDSIEDVQVSSEPAAYTINIDCYNLHVFFNPMLNSKSLYVLCPGYLERKKFTHPYFQRMSWLKSISSSGLIITDPTLSIHNDIGIAWFQGTKNRFAVPLIVKVIEKFRNFLNIKNSRILFYGSSAGGFASMMLATLMKGSCCVVNNPQTNVLRFREKIASEMLDRCYPSVSKIQIENFYIFRLSVLQTSIYLSAFTFKTSQMLNTTKIIFYHCYLN